MTSTSTTPLILDVDTGIDDSLALLYTVASPEADLVAVTCVSGNVEARQVATNTLALLELVGRTDIEVAVGREVPLERPLETTPETHGPAGIGYAELPPPSRAASDRHGVEVIVDAARRRPGDITLVTLGPLTNLAVALEREPNLPRLLRRHVLMGGAFGAQGNTTPTTEWNIHCDPEAARICFRAWSDALARDPTIARPIALGLDVTEGARIGPEHVVALARRAGSTPDDAATPPTGDPLAPSMSVASNPVVRFLADALRWYYEFHERYDGFYGAFIHDPLAVAAALDPRLITTEPLYVDVETRGELTTGMTVADRRGLTGRPPNVDVAATADIGAFLKRLIERLGGLAATLATSAGAQPAAATATRRAADRRSEAT
jgi:purine nucleosidase